MACVASFHPVFGQHDLPAEIRPPAVRDVCLGPLIEECLELLKPGHMVDCAFKVVFEKVLDYVFGVDALGKLCARVYVQLGDPIQDHTTSHSVVLWEIPTLPQLVTY